MTMDDMTPTHARVRRPFPWRAMRALIVVLAVALLPVFFSDMFHTVTTLLRPAFGRWAWTVPAATEGSFLVLYLLDLLLQWAGKPMGWLRLAPYPFAVASLLLNVYAARGDLPAMLGHGVITVAFFLPVLACEAAVRSLLASDEGVMLAQETALAMRHARDLVRDRKGPLWRYRVPSLLRVQIRRSRPPAAVADAIADGARYGGGAKWEPAVAAWITDGLTRGVRIAAAVKTATRQIERQASATEPAAPKRQAARRPARQRAARPAVATRDRAAAYEAEHAGASAAEVALFVGVDKRTVERWRKQAGGALSQQSAAAD